MKCSNDATLTPNLGFAGDLETILFQPVTDTNSFSAANPLWTSAANPFWNDNELALAGLGEMIGCSTAACTTPGTTYWAGGGSILVPNAATVLFCSLGTKMVGACVYKGAPGALLSIQRFIIACA